MSEYLNAEVNVSLPDSPATDQQISSAAVDVVGYSSFQEIFRHALPAKARLGQVTVAATIVDQAGYDSAAIEVLVIGYAASQRNVLRRAVLGGKQALITHQTRDGESFNALTIEARIVVDGVAGASGPQQATVACQSRFFLR